MRNKQITKRILALVLTLVLVTSLLPLNILAQAETPTVTPYYYVNWDGGAANLDLDYVYGLPWSQYTPGEESNPETIDISIFGNDAEESAINMKADFDKRPAGTRYLNLVALQTVLRSTAKDVVDMRDSVKLIKDYMTRLLTKYKEIGGQLDGIALDVEYTEASSWGLTDKIYNAGNTAIYNQIAANEFYQSTIKPKLDARNFEYYTGADVAEKSVLWNIHYTYGKQSARNIWDDVINELLAESFNEAVYEPLKATYPDAILCDYVVADTYRWQKLMAQDGGMVGTGYKIGNTSTQHIYDAVPGYTFFGYPSAEDSSIRSKYTTPYAYNGAVYPDSPYGHALWDVIRHKTALEALDLDAGENLTSWIAAPYYKSGNGYSGTAYYSEAVLHAGLMSTTGSILGYTIKNEVAGSAQPDVDRNLQIVNDLMAELTRMAGASDRKPIVTPINWNDGYILTGAYAGGRNIWRITPDTSKVSVKDFKTKDQAPTFSVGELTVIFPQGRIIEDGDITDLGTCGYWVETPAGVNPVVISNENRYAQDPSFKEDFEGYAAGTFTADSVKPDTYWNVNGTANIQENNGGKTLALSGNTTLTNTKVPSKITAGDNFANEQIWEVTVTMPTTGSNYTIQLLSFDETIDGGVYIQNGSIYCVGDNDLNAVSNVTLVAGSTYTIRRKVDFNKNQQSLYVYDAAGTELGKVENATMVSPTKLPIENIYFITNGVTDSVVLDNYKLYPAGVTTDFALYDVFTGMELDNTAANLTKDTAYRLSWMNASSEYKVAEIWANDKVIKEVPMASGMDGVVTGIVEVNEGESVTLTLQWKENATEPEYPNFDNDDFDWDSYADNMGITCIVGDYGYATLEEGITAAKNGQAVVMMKDAVMKAPAIATTAFTIQDNGYSIKTANDFSGDYAIAVVQGSELNWNINIDADDKTALWVCGGVVNVTGGTISGKNGVEIVGGKLNMTGGAISATENAIALSQDIFKLPVAVEVTGGELTGTYAFYHENTTGTPSKNVSATIIKTAVASIDKVATVEAHYEIQEEGDNYILHGHTVVIDPAVAPSCTEPGLTEGLRYSCCDRIVTEQEIVGLLSHNYEGAVTLPTCTADGYTTYTCSACGDSYKDNYTDPVEHTLSVKTENEVEGTCTTEGSYEHVIYCTVCGTETSRKTVTTPAKHAYTADKTTKPGYTILTCSCGHSAEYADVGFYFKTSGDNSGWIVASAGYSLKMTPGDVAYYTTEASTDANYPNHYYMKTAQANDAWNVKIEYLETGLVVMHLKNATIRNGAGIFFGHSDALLSTPIKIVVEGTCDLSSPLATTSSGRLNLFTTGDVTIEGPGTLILDGDSDRNNLTASGNLTLDNVNINITDTKRDHPQQDSAISSGGNLLIKGGKLNIRAWENTTGWPSNKGVIGSAIKAAGTLTVQDNAYLSVIATTTDAAISATAISFDNSRVEVALGGAYCMSKAFSVAPSVTNCNGYDVVGATTKVPYNAETDTLTLPVTESYNQSNALNYYYFRISSPAVKFGISVYGNKVETSPNLTLSPGQTLYYVTVANKHNPDYIANTGEGYNGSYVLDTTGATSENWDAKFEYPIDGIPTITFQNATLKNSTGIRFYGPGDLKIVVKGNCSMNASRVFNYAANPVYNDVTGSIVSSSDGTVTITGNGTLNFTETGAPGPYVQVAGNLVLDNIDISLVDRVRNHPVQTFLSVGGNTIIKGGSLSVDAYYNGANDYPANCGPLGYVLTGAGNLTIQDGADIDIVASSLNPLFKLDGTVSIDVSEVEITSCGTFNSTVFNQAPTLLSPDAVNAVGSANTASYNAETGVLTAPTTDSYNQANAAGYKYIKIAHKCVAGEPVWQESAACATQKTGIPYCAYCGAEMAPVTETKAPTAEHKLDDVAYTVKVKGDATTNGTYEVTTACSVCGETSGVPVTEEFEPAKFTFAAVADVIGSAVTVVNPGETLHLIVKEDVLSGNASATPDGTNYTEENKEKYFSDTSILTATGADKNNWDAKIEYPLGGTPTLTLKDVNLKNATGIRFVSTSCDLNIVLQGTNKVATSYVFTWKTANTPNNTTTSNMRSAIHSASKGTVTISGTGSLVLENITNDQSALYAAGNVVLDNTNVEILLPVGQGYGIQTPGNITINNTDLFIDGHSNSGTAMRAAFVGANLTIENGSDVFVAGSAIKVNDTISSLVEVTNLTIKNSDVELGASGTQYQPAISGVPGVFTLEGCKDTVFAENSSWPPDYNNTDRSFSPNPGVIQSYVDQSNLGWAFYFKTTHICTEGEIDWQESAACATQKTGIPYCKYCGVEMAPVTGTKDQTAEHKLDDFAYTVDQAGTASADGYYLKSTACSVCGETSGESERVPFEPAKFTFATVGDAIGTGVTFVNPNETLYLIVKEDVLNYAGGTPDGTNYTEENKEKYFSDTSILTATGADKNNWDAKIEYPLGGTPTLTLKDVNLKNATGIRFVSTSCDLNIVLQGTNKVATNYVFVWKTVNTPDNTTISNIRSAILSTSSGTVTISGSGSLSVEAVGSGVAAIETTGDLVLDNANVATNDTTNVGATKTYGIKTGGDVTIKGGELRISGLIDHGEYPSGTLNAAIYAGDKLTIQDGAKVSAIASFYYYNSSTGAVLKGIEAAGGVTITDSEVEFAACGGYFGEVFSKAPVLNLSKGYAAIAGEKNGTYNFETGEFTAPATVAYNKEDAASYHYFKISKVPVLPDLQSHVTLGSSLSFTMAIPVNSIKDFAPGGQLTAKITRDGEPVNNAKVSTIIEGGVAYYTVEYTGIAAKEMGDTFTVTLIDSYGNEVIKRSDSIVEYARRLLDDYKDDAKLKQVVVNMLNYGAAAQVYFGYNADNLVTNILTEEEAALAPTSTPTYADNNLSTVVYEEGVTEGFIGSSLKLDNNIHLYVVADRNIVGEGAYAVVSYNDQSVRIDGVKNGNRYMLFGLDQLVAAEGGVDVTFAIYNSNGDPLFTVKDSVVKYCGRVEASEQYEDNDPLKELTRALVHYSDAADAYFN